MLELHISVCMEYVNNISSIIKNMELFLTKMKEEIAQNDKLEKLEENDRIKPDEARL